jgi:thiamine biosynthesis lipoprotein
VVHRRDRHHRLGERRGTRGAGFIDRQKVVGHRHDHDDGVVDGWTRDRVLRHVAFGVTDQLVIVGRIDGHDNHHALDDGQQAGDHLGAVVMGERLLERDPLREVAGSEPEQAATARRSIRAIGTTAVVIVTDTAVADEALTLLAADLGALDATCSRFLDDSEIRRVERRSHGRPVVVSALLFDALAVACAVAEQTAGTVDPTTGAALVGLGYDRDFDEIGGSMVSAEFRPVPAPGWWRIGLDAEARTVVIPDGVHVDLGSSAKAFAADRAAQAIATILGCGVLVNLGGDVALAGHAPTEGWAIGIGTHSSTPADEVDAVLAVFAGGLATSGTTGRTWVHGGRLMHHIVDPWTGEPADPVWSLVSVLAPTCVEANAWSTAAVVWGEDAPGNLSAHAVSARLVRPDGRVLTVGGWPTDPASDAASFVTTKGAVQTCSL